MSKPIILTFLSLSLQSKKHSILTKSIIFINVAFVALAVMLLLASCRKDNAYYEGKARISVSTDTLSFDTVFTKVGSSTKYFKVYNYEKQPVVIDLSLKKNDAQFRINVDGIKGRVFEKVEIPSNDSIYVFIETTVNPDDPLSISPFIIEDEIIISQGQSTINVTLIANGQNANYLPRVNGQGLISYLSCNLNKVNWNDAKPYVIYGILVIDSCELVIPAGTKIYVHGGLAKSDGQFYSDGQIIVLANGKITVKGSAEKKVEIQGDRLEADFRDVAGQWGGIRIFKGSINNTIEHAIIKNSIIGISIDSSASLSIKSSIIKNISSIGLYAIHATLYADNMLIFGTGSSAIALTYGGNYELNYCSFSTDINQDESLLVNNYRCTDPLCSGQILTNNLNLIVNNTIISGGSEDEIILDPLKKEDLGKDAFDIKLSNCIVRVKDLIKEKAFPNFFDYCKECYNLKFNDKLFLDKSNNDYRLDTMSVGLSKAIPIPVIPFDLLGKNRDPLNPDLGCYEF